MLCPINFGRFGPRPCEKARTLNRDRTSYSFKTDLGAHIASRFNIEIELKNFVLAVLRVFEFSHRLGHFRTHAPQQIASSPIASLGADERKSFRQPCFPKSLNQQLRV